MPVTVERISDTEVIVSVGENTLEAARSASIASAAAEEARVATTRAFELIGRAADYDIQTANGAVTFATLGLEASFADDIYRDGEETLASVTDLPGWNLTRAATAFVNDSGVLTPVASGSPRLNDSGLLVEPARTNLLLQSQDFDNAAWSKNNATITANTAPAPDGTTTADKLVANSTNLPTAQQSVTLAAGFHTFTIYAKMVERRFLVVNFLAKGFDNYTYFDLQNGAVGSASGDSIASIEALAGGWYRCRVTRSATAGTRTVVIHHTPVDGSLTPQTPGQGVLVWGAQIEAGLEPTSYIATAGATASRPADDARLSFSPGTRGAIYIEFVHPRVQNEFTVSVLSSNSGETPVSSAVGAVGSNNGSTTLQSGYVANSGETVRAVLTWGPEGRKLAVNGEIGRDAEGIGTIAVLSPGNFGSLNGVIRRMLILGGVTLSDADAVAMSGGSLTGGSGGTGAFSTLAVENATAGGTTRKGLTMTFGGEEVVYAGQQGSDGFAPGAGVVGVRNPSNGDVTELTHYQYGGTLKHTGQMIELFLNDDPVGIGELSVRGIVEHRGARLNARNGADTTSCAVVNIDGRAGVSVTGSLTDLPQEMMLAHERTDGVFGFRIGTTDGVMSGGTLVAAIGEEGLRLKHRASAPTPPAGYTVIWAKNDGTVQRTSNVGGVLETVAL